MLNFVKVISSKIDPLKRRVIKFLRYGNSDILEVVESSPFGIDSVPVKDLVAVYGETSSKGKSAIVGYLNINRLADIGEARLFSTDSSSNLKTYIWLKNTGNIEIGGDTDNMVRYSELEAAFNELKTDLNNLVTTFNSHIHTTSNAVPGSPVIVAPTTTPGSNSTADISPAKIDEIKTI